MKRVFVDTGGFFAALAKEDPHHLKAKEVFELANDQRWKLVTTNAVVVEGHALFLNRAHAGPASALVFLDAVLGSEFTIERVQPEDEDRAIALIRRHKDKTYSLCDALSFMVMERLGITEAIAFDRHFREYGKIIVL